MGSLRFKANHSHRSNPQIMTVVGNVAVVNLIDTTRKARR